MMAWNTELNTATRPTNTARSAPSTRVLRACSDGVRALRTSAIIFICAPSLPRCDGRGPCVGHGSWTIREPVGRSPAIGYGVPTGRTSVDPYFILLAVIGSAIVGAAVLRRALTGVALSPPILYLVTGMVIFALPLGLDGPRPGSDEGTAERLTELVVIVSLMGAGLKLNRPPAWRSWTPTWRLLGITMPADDRCDHAPGRRSARAGGLQRDPPRRRGRADGPGARLRRAGGGPLRGGRRRRGPVRADVRGRPERRPGLPLHAPRPRRRRRRRVGRRMGARVRRDPHRRRVGGGVGTGTGASPG